MTRCSFAERLLEPRRTQPAKKEGETAGPGNAPVKEMQSWHPSPFTLPDLSDRLFKTRVTSTLSVGRQAHSVRFCSVPHMQKTGPSFSCLRRPSLPVAQTKPERRSCFRLFAPKAEALASLPWLAWKKMKLSACTATSGCLSTPSRHISLSNPRAGAHNAPVPNASEPEMTP